MCTMRTRMKNMGGSSVAFDFKDDCGYGGPLTGTTFRVRLWNYGGDTNEALANFATIAGGSDISRLHINKVNGSVDIGTTNAQNALSVNGTVQAKEVLVNTGWSDYVFGPGYHLQSLSEVAAFVQANHHLPDIPSEAEVKEKGVKLGEMQAKLLAKVEELTLHMIEADERNRSLEQQNRELQDRVARLEAAAKGRADQ